MFMAFYFVSVLSFHPDSLSLDAKKASDTKIVWCFLRFPNCAEQEIIVFPRDVELIQLLTLQCDVSMATN